MANPGADARIQDLKRRIELDPASRLFVALAEEYRKTGRLAEALSTLQKGLLAHPNYVSAQVALGRAYLESGQITEAIATFSKVLAADPGNLVSAKSLADIYLSRGETLEAVKKYKLYRALSGDRTVEDVISRLEKQLAPPPSPFAPPPAAVVPPPPTFVEAAEPPSARPAVETAPAPAEAPFEMTPISFDAPPPPSWEPAPPPAASSAPPPVLDALPAVTTQIFRVGEFGTAAPAPPQPPAPRHPAEEPEPQGRTLADLYFAQGHYAEALRIYDELVAANPFDDELRRLRRDAEARLLPAGSASVVGSADPLFERRLKRIRALRQWLSVLQAG